MMHDDVEVEGGHIHGKPAGNLAQPWIEDWIVATKTMISASFLWTVIYHSNSSPEVRVGSTVTWHKATEDTFYCWMQVKPEEMPTWMLMQLENDVISILLWIETPRPENRNKQTGSPVPGDISFGSIPISTLDAFGSLLNASALAPSCIDNDIMMFAESSWKASWRSSTSSNRCCARTISTTQHMGSAIVLHMLMPNIIFVLNFHSTSSSQLGCSRGYS